MPRDNVRDSSQHENERTSEEAAHNSPTVMSFHLFRTETGLTANVKSRARYSRGCNKWKWHLYVKARLYLSNDEDVNL